MNSNIRLYSILNRYPEVESLIAAYDVDPEDENAVATPYVITIDYDSEKIVSIRRNYREDDEKKKRRDWFVSYKFLPGLGFYGFGLFHLIGGLGKAAT